MKEKFRYIPEGSTEILYPEVNAVVYMRSINGRFSVLAYSAKRTKPDFYYLFKTAEVADKYIEEYLNGLKLTLDYKATKKAEKKAYVPDVKVGDVFVSSWGYDQTNVDYYEVVDLVGAKSVVIRPIKATYEETGFMSGYVTPVPGSYWGEPVKKLVGNGGYIKVGHNYAHKHTGGKNYSSSYA